jgi:hypothetical protein
VKMCLSVGFCESIIFGEFLRYIKVLGEIQVI